MKTRKYPWSLGAQLAAQVQARDLDAAQKQASTLLDIIGQSSDSTCNEEIKLRLVQVLTLASRGAYNAGADPERLVEANLDLIHRILSVKTKRQLQTLAKKTIRTFITLIPEADLCGAKRVAEAVGYIRRHCGENVSRSAVAKLLGCSPSYVSTLFRRQTGRTFKDTVLHFRIERAKVLLGDHHKNVTEVAFDVGYQDPNYFIACFRRVAGITPGQYRRSMAGTS